MEMPVKKWEIPAVVILAFFVLVMVLAVLLFPNKNKGLASSQVVSVMGGVLHSAALDTMNTKTIRNQAEDFLRGSQTVPTSCCINING